MFDQHVHTHYHFHGLAEAQFQELKGLITMTKQEVTDGLAAIRSTEAAEAELLGSVATVVGQVQTDVALLIDKIENMPQPGATVEDVEAWRAEVVAIKERQMANNTALQAAAEALAAVHASANPETPPEPAPEASGV